MKGGGERLELFAAEGEQMSPFSRRLSAVREKYLPRIPLFERRGVR